MVWREQFGGENFCERAYCRRPGTFLIAFDGKTRWPMRVCKKHYDEFHNNRPN